MAPAGTVTGAAGGLPVGRLSDGGGGVEIRKPAATLPDRRLGVDFVLPQLFAGVGIQGDDVVVRRADEHFVADLQRGHLVFRTVAVADGDVAGVVGPGRHEFGDVIAVDLVQRRKTAAAFVVTVMRPVFLRPGRIDLGQGRAVTGRGHRRVRLKHAPETGCHGNRQKAAQQVTALTARQTVGLAQCRVNQRHQQAQYRQREQARDQWPEHQSSIHQRPDHGQYHDRGEQPGARDALFEQQKRRGDHTETGQQEVPAATQRNKVAATRCEK